METQVLFSRSLGALRPNLHELSMVFTTGAFQIRASVTFCVLRAVPIEEQSGERTETRLLVSDTPCWTLSQQSQETSCLTRILYVLLP